MRDIPAIAVVDEGEELDDIRSILEEFGLEFASWRKGDVPIQQKEPRHLLVCTASAAVSLAYRRAGGGEGLPTWVAVTENDSRTQRTLLLQAGFDFLVRRPVHPTALRLLLQRSLFAGDEQRRGPRVAVGYGITFRKGLLPKKATLVDLSPGGCRLLSTTALEPGTQITVHIPGEIDGGAGFGVKAKVLRTRRAELEGGESGEVALAMRFVGMGRGTKLRLRKMLSSLEAGPPSIPDEGSSPVRTPRSTYQEPVYVFGSADCALVGRDLSSGGMRVDPHPALNVGDELRIALSLGAREEPLVIDAKVIRDDGPQGMAIGFKDVEDPDRLSQMVETLPSIESLAPADSGTAAVVVSKIVPQLQRFAQQGRDWSDVLRRKR